MLVSPAPRDSENLEVTAVDGRRAGVAASAPPWLALAALLAVILAACGARNHTVMNHDVAWLTVAAARMLAGGSYADSFFEMNMPLAIALHVPALMIARMTHLATSTAMDLWVGTLAAQSVLLVLRVIPEDILPRSPPTARIVAAAWLLAGLLLVPGYDYGQREHLMMILALPWIAHCATAPGTVGGALRIYLVCLASVGILLKPHYAALPLLLIGIRAVSSRDSSTLRTDAVLYLGLALAYVLLVRAYFPEWFEIAGWARDLYAGFHRGSLLSLLLSWPLPLVLCGLLVMAGCLAISVTVTPFATPLLAVSAYGLISHVAQYKGWSYQLLPVTIAVFMIGGVIALLAFRPGAIARPRQRLLQGAAALALLIALALVTSSLWRLPPAANLPRTTLAKAFDRVPVGAPVLVLSTTLIPAFPTVLLRDRAWGSRLPSLWPLAGIEYLKRRGGRADVVLAEDYARRLRDIVREDFARYRPALVLVDRRAGQFGLPPGYSILGFLEADSRFARAWRDYRMIGHSPDYTIHLRRSAPRSAVDGAEGRH